MEGGEGAYFAAQSDKPLFFSPLLLFVCNKSICQSVDRSRGRKGLSINDRLLLNELLQLVSVMLFITISNSFLPSSVLTCMLCSYVRA